MYLPNLVFTHLYWPRYRLLNSTKSTPNQYQIDAQLKGQIDNKPTPNSQLITPDQRQSEARIDTK